ncbi:peptidylprolyl isomerase [Wenzhouxiangella sp. EGI_FJ10409]|uniref:peptidylprolyl isomerase n=1 Tax=Wenzhouxiangella sp. EGI_FJ10409 TaxID=3243767 RepID=UPI0035E28A0C
MARSIALLFGALGLLCACQDVEQGDPEAASGAPAAPDVLARYAGGEVSLADVDARILALPADERPTPGTRLDAWYADLIRELAVERILLERASRAEVAQSEGFRRSRAMMERQLAVRACLAQVAPASLRLSDEELDQAYTERLDRFQAPERRAAFHIYLRRESGEQIDDLESEMRALRERILRGENFQRVARAESDSESRHVQGRIGWVTPGELPQAFDRLVFSLDEGVPSEPMVTADGVHMFQVDDILPERRLSRREAVPVLRNELGSEKLEAAIEELAAKNTSPSARIVSQADLEQLVEAGAEQEAVLVAEDYTLRLQDLRARLRGVLATQDGTLESLGDRIPMDFAWQFLNRQFRQELAYEYCGREALFSGETVAAQLSAWEERALVGEMRQRLLRERVADDRDRLELYYRSNIGQYTPPVQWNLTRLSLGLDRPQEARSRMARLEEAVDEGGVGLDALQQELGGEVEPLGWNTLPQIRQINSKLAQLVSSVKEGELVAPLRARGQLELYEVTGRKEFEPRPFEDVFEAVVAAYLRQYTSEVYAEVESELLDSAGFELFPERLDRLREVIPPEPEITVEQLDALLSGS